MGTGAEDRLLPSPFEEAGLSSRMGIPLGCKRLIEADFPIAAVGDYCAVEKTVFSGRPSNLHQWWARRPLAACRAVLMGLLLPDPCDPLCPDAFKEKARKLL